MRSGQVANAFGVALRDPAGACFALGVSFFLAVGLIGVPLAAAGLFRRYLVIPLVLVATVAVARVLLSIIPSPTGTVVSTIALVIAGVFAGFVAVHSGQHILADRDPGVYALTALWLTEKGNLTYDPGVPNLVEMDGSSWHPGFHIAENGKGYFQFQHAPPAAFAVFHWALGFGGLVKANAVIGALGVLGVYLVSRILTGPWVGLIPLAFVATHPAVVHVAKDLYSEPLALALTMAALLSWHGYRNQPTPSAALATGLLIGSPTLVRIDGWMTVGAAMVGIAVLGLTTRGPRPIPRGQVRYTLFGVLVSCVIGLGDLLLTSPVYFSHLQDRAVPIIILAAVAIVIAAILLGRGARISRPPMTHLSWIAASVALLLGLYALYLRPLGTHPGTDTEFETLSMEWLAWYQGRLGVTLLIAGVALAALTYIRRVDQTGLVALACFLVPAVVYFYDPSISPDHLWAMRRFVPTILPLFHVLAVAGLVSLTRRIRSGGPVLAGALLVFAGMTLQFQIDVGSPVATIRTHVGLHEGMLETCDLIGDAAVIYDDSAWHVAPAVRIVCGNPVFPEEHLDDVVEIPPGDLIHMSVHGECSGDPITIPYQYTEINRNEPPDEAFDLQLTLFYWASGLTNPSCLRS